MMPAHPARRTLRLLLVVLAAAAPVDAALCQTAVSLTPRIGLFTGTSANRLFFSDFSPTPIPVRFKHDIGVSPGLIGTVWFTRSLGLELGASYALSDLRATYAGGVSGSENAYVWMVTADLRLALPTPAPPLTVNFTVGPGVIGRGGRAYSADGRKVDPAFIAGGGASLRLGRRLIARLELEGCFSSAEYPVLLSSRDRTPQQYFLLWAGLAIPLKTK